MKKRLALLLILCLCLGLLCGCDDPVIGPGPGSESQSPAAQSPTSAPAAADTSPKGAAISLNGDSASFSGGGVSVSGSTVTIASPGEYSVSGTLTDGCIVVNTGEVKGDVTLTLRGADITNLSGSAIRVDQVKNFILVLENGSRNRLVSGREGDADDGVKRDGAVLFSEDDVDILGEGSLEILGYLNNGITCKDDLDPAAR